MTRHVSQETGLESWLLTKMNKNSRNLKH